MSHVCVTEWCPSPAESAVCLQVIFTVQNDIDAALLHTLPWCSGRVLPGDAIALAKCINDCGGAATVVQDCVDCA